MGRATWDSIYQRFTTLRNVDGPMLNLRVLAYPGYDLKEGSQGEIVKFVQFMLAFIGVFYDGILPIDSLTDVYGPETAASVRSFQREFNLPQTGVMDETTWNTMVIIYLSPVSYTHLDVYKRQLPDCARSRRHGPRRSAPGWPGRSYSKEPGC